jgi:hypothetical protein
MDSINCPKGLDADYQHRTCRNCGRSIHFVRATGGPHGRKAHWQHTSDMAGLAWKREYRRLHQ